MVVPPHRHPLHVRDVYVAVTVQVVGRPVKGVARAGVPAVGDTLHVRDVHILITVKIAKAVITRAPSWAMTRMVWPGTLVT